MRIGFFVGVLMLGFASVAHTQGAAQAEHPVLVELFTSEGCSSCPPADAELRKLHEMHTPSGTLVIGLSEHVTYWNQIGWVDRFSDDGFTERQRQYSERLGSDVYTPQVVVNGTVQVLGSAGSEIVRAVEASKATGVAVRIDSAKVVGAKLEVVYAVQGPLPKGGVDVLVVPTDDEDTTNVRSGENGGRTLTHVSVARGLTRVATVKDSGERTATVGFAVGGGGGHHVVVIAQESGQGRVLAVQSRGL